MLQTTITPNFQVHIPVAIREQSGITEHGTAIISAQKGKIIIESKPSGFLALGNSFRVKKLIKAEQIREHIDYSK